MYQHTGVADGVGGWSSEGVDASFFSKALMNNCVKVARKGLADLDKPVDILTRALRETLWLHSKAYGEHRVIFLKDFLTAVLQ